MASLLYRLGRRFFRARKLVAAVWVAILVVIGGAALAFNAGTDNGFSIPGTESSDALEELSRTFPQVSGSSASIVVVAPDGAAVTDDDVRGPVEDAVDQLADVDQVAGVNDPYSDDVTGAVSDNERAAMISVQMEVQGTAVTDEAKAQLQDEVQALRDALPEGSEVALGGQLFSTSIPKLTITEAVGVIVALVVLVLTFGSFLAAGMPLLTALLGVAASMAGIFVATAFTTVNSTTPLLALMLGLAVGIDYALFIISRHQDQLRDGMEPEESAARALATAGSAVVFAGLTVIIALVGLFVAGIPFLTTMGIAAAVAVAVAVVIALTLTPALLGFAGDRLRPKPSRRQRRAAAKASAGGAVDAAAATEVAPARPNRFFAGWVRLATRRPLLTVVAVVVGLAIVSLPALSLRLALPDPGVQPLGSGPRTTYDLVDREFGAGFNGPLIVTSTIIGSTDPLELMDDLKAELEALPGVHSVPLATPNATADTGIIQVVPNGGPNSEATKALVQEIRSMHDAWQEKYGVDIAVTGQTAVGIDISDRLGGALLPFGLLVVGLSFVLLTMVFRSIWVPVKATVGYLLSVTASFGVVAMVFEFGWGAELLHIDRTGPVLSFMPILLMGVLFGLAMDYEVFLVSRIREDYVHGGDARAAIRTGFVASAKVVTAAAIIMFSVFAAFVPEGEISIKTIALGLAAGVFVDAFIVRMTLVPAVLQLLGDRAWHMPRWLDRILPSFDVEGEALARELELADWPEPGARDVVAAAGLRVHGVAQPVDVRVQPGEALVIEGAHRTGRSALLLTLAGRAAPEAGTLKVAGLAAPIRAADIRRRVAVVRATGNPEAVDDVRAALAPRPAVLAIDDIDAIVDPHELAELRRLLADAAAHGAGRDGHDPLTLIVSCADAAMLDGVLPTISATVLATDAAPRRELTKVN